MTHTPSDAPIDVAKRIQDAVATLGRGSVAHIGITNAGITPLEADRALRTPTSFWTMPFQGISTWQEAMRRDAQLILAAIQARHLSRAAAGYLAMPNLDADARPAMQSARAQTRHLLRFLQSARARLRLHVRILRDLRLAREELANGACTFTQRPTFVAAFDAQGMAIVGKTILDAHTRTTVDDALCEALVRHTGYPT